jgi:SnoaL-like domain
MPTETTTARDTADAIAAAIEARDHDDLMALYADDVVFHSPVTPNDFHGKEAVSDLMAHVLGGFESWERTFVLADGELCVFGVSARISGREVEMTEEVHVDADGRVREQRIYGRPLAGVAAIAAVAGPRMARRRGRLRATLVRALAGSLPGALARGDALVTRLAR